MASNHRHHKPAQGHRFSLACYDGDRLYGVAIVGRPVSRRIDQCNTVEVLRLCTDGTKNACRVLYAACRRSARELGYRQIITYILETESGVSLKASGWNFLYIGGGGNWSVPSRPRETEAPTCKKQLYESLLR